MKILLIAEESAGLRLLTEIARLPHEIVAVMATEPLEGSEVTSVWNAAKKMGYQTWPAKWVKDPSLPTRVKEADVDLILNVHSLFIIPEALLSSPKIGAFNLHPGILPEFAGLNSPSWAIYQGEKKHGVTLHKMEPGIDTGAIVFQDTFDISQNDTGLSVALGCVRLGVPLVLKLLDIASKDPALIPMRPQAVERRRYFGKEVPQAGRIIWDKPAVQVFNFVRACDYYPFKSPWGKPSTRCRGQEVSVLKAALSGRATGEVPGSITFKNDNCFVSCSDEWLKIQKISLGMQNHNPQECLSDGDRFDLS